MPRKPAAIAIAGSRKLPPGQAPRMLARFLAALPDGSRVLLRRGSMPRPPLFERDVETLCDLFGLTVEWMEPEPTPELPGRRATWARDEAMIEEADLILTFVLEEQVGDETSGTDNLREKALRANKVIYSYSVLTYGENDVIVQRVGEHDPGNRWAELVPAV